MERSSERYPLPSLCIYNRKNLVGMESIRNICEGFSLLLISAWARAGGGEREEGEGKE